MRLPGGLGEGGVDVGVGVLHPGVGVLDHQLEPRRVLHTAHTEAVVGQQIEAATTQGINAINAIGSASISKAAEAILEK